MSIDIRATLDLHAKWMRGDDGGARADLRCADLSGADLRWTDLRCADLRWANIRWTDLRCADLRGADLSGADLRWTDLRGANLSGADLSGADLDFSSGVSFRCGSFGFKAGLRLASQLAYHFCRIDFVDCPEAVAAQRSLVDLANRFHRVDECGTITATAIETPAEETEP